MSWVPSFSTSVSIKIIIDRFFFSAFSCVAVLPYTVRIQEWLGHADITIIDNVY